MRILRFAQEVDRSAQRFYEEMALRSDNPGVARIFRMLADDEGELLNRHRALAGSGNAVGTETLDREENVFERLRGREDQFTVEDDVSAYRLALDAEREVLRHYRSAARAEKESAAKGLLTAIARDEQQHVEELENVYDFANAPNHYLAWGEFSNLGEFHNFGRDNV